MSAASAGEAGTALVTGGCSGIGRAIAERLAARGHPLVLVSDRPARLAEAAAAIRARHRVAVTEVAMDLAHPQAAGALHRQLGGLGLEVDVLVNNAGMFFFGEVADADPARAAALLSLHVVTASLLCTHFVPAMRARRRGHVLFVSSISAFRDFPGIAYYGSSKKYLRGFSRALRSELSVHGVNVTCLCPGAVATDLYAPGSVDMGRARRLRLMSTPELVAEAAVRAMLAGRAECIPGRLWWLLAHASARLPQPLIDLVRRRGPWLRPRPENH